MFFSKPVEIPEFAYKGGEYLEFVMEMPIQYEFQAARIIIAGLTVDNLSPRRWTFNDSWFDSRNMFEVKRNTMKGFRTIARATRLSLALILAVSFFIYSGCQPETSSGSASDSTTTGDNASRVRKSKPGTIKALGSDQEEQDVPSRKMGVEQ